MARPSYYKMATYSPINPEISKADRNRTRRATARAVRSGRLVKPDVCQHCEKPDRKVEAHHPDYRDHLNVMWLCRWCHWDEHRRITQAVEFYVWQTNEKFHREYREKATAEKAARIAEAQARWPEVAAARARKVGETKQRVTTAREMAGKGESVTAIAAATGLTLSGASRLLKRNGISGSWRQSEPIQLRYEIVAGMAADGATQARIADRLNVSVTTVCHFMKRHGIAPSRGRPNTAESAA